MNLGPGVGMQKSPLVQQVVDAGRLREIVPHPTDPNILYVATAGGGVWKSFDAQATINSSAGPHWTSITAGVGSQSIGAFALDPNSPDSLYLGLGDPFDVQTPGFYTSADGGITWDGPNLLGDPGNPATSVREIVVNPARTGVVLVATDQGIFRSVAGGLGATWVVKPMPGGNGACWSLAWVGAVNGEQAWLASCQGGVFRSTDDGASWAAVALPDTNVGRMTLAAARGDSANPNAARVYLLAGKSTDGDQEDVFRSTDGGRTFTSLNMPGTLPNDCGPGCHQPAFWTNHQRDFDVLHDQAWYNQAITVDPRNGEVVFIGGNLAAMRTDDGGKTWYVVTDWLPNDPINGSSLPYVHADWHAMAIATTGPTALFYAGTDGGLFRSSDVFTGVPTSTPNDPANSCYRGSCIHFEDRLNRGLTTHLAYSLATDVHDLGNPTLIGGLQDNGTRLRTASNPTAFDQIYGGDGFGVGIGISNSNSVPASCKNGIKPKWGSLLLGSIYSVPVRSVDCGQNFSAALNGICSSQGIVPDCNVDFRSNFLMKIASEPADPTGQTVLTVINNSQCPDPANTGKCVPAAGYNQVFASHNGAFSWTRANGTITLASGTTAAYFPSQLRFVGTNPLIANQWSVTTRSRVYTTLNGGGTWQESGLLPGISPSSGGASSVAFEGTTGSVLWASAKISGAGRIVRSADRGASWVDKSADLPAVPVNVLAVDPNDPQTVYAGTELGLYRSQNGGQSWLRYGVGLPLVSVTEINVMLDSSAIRISTFGRGFWELSTSSISPTGVYGNGDFDKNQVIDAFDLVREAALLGDSARDDDYDATGNLTGAINAIDGADFTALVAKLGGRP